MAESNIVTFSVELPGARRVHELRFKLGETVRERHGCIKVKTAIDDDDNELNVCIIMMTELEQHPASERVRGRLNNDIGVLKLLDHRHVLKLFQVFASEDRTYVVTERATTSLAAYVEKRGGSLDPQLACSLFNQLLSAVAYVHGMGLAHRCITPDCVYIDEAAATIRLADFECACLQSSRDLLKDRPEGLNPHYTAPEMRETADPSEPYHGKKADAYSVAAVLFFMLTGEHPPLDGEKAAEDERIGDPIRELLHNSLLTEWKRVEGNGRFGVEDMKLDGWVCSGRRHSSTGDNRQPALDEHMLRRASHCASGVGFTRPAGQLSPSAVRKPPGGGLSLLSVDTSEAPRVAEEGMSSPESLCDDSFSPLPRRGPRVFGDLVPEKAAQLNVDSVEPTPFDLSPPSSPSSKSKSKLKLNTLDGVGRDGVADDADFAASPMGRKARQRLNLS